MIRGLPRETKTIVLVGLMGAGKTCIGRRLARRLELPFVDTDDEVEKAAGAAIPEIFRRFGEQAFRDGERRVIARLLSGPPQVLATGGGAFIDQWTRAAIRESAVSVWLRAELDILVGRTVGRDGRPLLETSDPRATLAALMAARHPIYALADLVIDSTDEPPEVTTDRVLAALNGWRSGGTAAAAEAGA